MTSPIFPGAVVVPRISRFGAIVGFWCRWCERVHTFGLGGVPASTAVGMVFARGSHCLNGRSPLAGRGVSIRAERLVRFCEALEPPGPALGRPGEDGRETLFELTRGSELAAIVARHLFDQVPTAEALVPGRFFEIDLVDGWARYEDGGWWEISNEGREVLDAGNTLLGLLARIFGVGPGVAFVRVAGAALGVDLTPTTALAVAEAIDAQFAPTPAPED